jgi:hypothetical protein
LGSAVWNIAYWEVLFGILRSGKCCLEYCVVGSAVWNIACWEVLFGVLRIGKCCLEYSARTEYVWRTELSQSKLGQRVHVPVVLTVRCSLHTFILHVRITPALPHMQDVKLLFSNSYVRQRVMYWLMRDQ